MLKAIVVQLLHHRLRFLWPHASNDRLCLSEISDTRSRSAVSKEVPRICVPTPLAPATSGCVDVFGLSGLPAEVSIILCESAHILATWTKRLVRAEEEAAVPNDRSCHVTQRTPINTNRVATTGRAWCCVANARSIKRVHPQ